MTTSRYSDADKFVVRLNEGQRNRISVLAKEQGRSMNTYITRALERQLREEEGGVTSTSSVSAATPILGPNMPCRLNGQVALITKIYFWDGVLTAKVINGKGEGWTCKYEDLEAY